ncbi:MAG: PilZ domain-containing protein [Pseudomonadota bacterium]|nr:PilZ domain-containing protein [Pseudomonadota bacterium]
MTTDASNSMTRTQTHASARPSLMLRSAKVVCQTGQYACVIRDVSKLGTSIAFLHEVPPEPRILLSLGNGLIYPIERVWAGKRQAGYRFANELELTEFIHESAPFEARPVRLEIKTTARLIDGRDHHHVKLLDISTHGAKFESGSKHAEQRLIGFQVQGMAQQLGKVVWQSDEVFGLQFQQPIALQELALAALRLQPYDAPIKGGFSEALSNARAA